MGPVVAALAASEARSAARTEALAVTIAAQADTIAAQADTIATQGVRLNHSPLPSIGRFTALRVIHSKASLHGGFV